MKYLIVKQLSTDNHFLWDIWFQSLLSVYQKTNIILTGSLLKSLHIKHFASHHFPKYLHIIKKKRSLNIGHLFSIDLWWKEVIDRFIWTIELCTIWIFFKHFSNRTLLFFTTTNAMIYSSTFLRTTITIFIIFKMLYLNLMFFFLYAHCLNSDFEFQADFHRRKTTTTPH
jgi:hypothetical protein